KTVIIKPTPPPEKPKPLPPLKLKLKSTKKTSFNLLNWLIPTAHAQNAGFVDLTWPAIDDADFYEIEIFTDKKLRNKILTVPSRDNTHRWNVLRAGKYYWRYRYRDYWGRFSPYSDPSELEISPATISPQKPVVAKKSAPVKPQTSTSI